MSDAMRTCEHCQEPAPAKDFRVFTFHDRAALPDAPRTGLQGVLEVKLCPTCHAAAVADEEQRLGPSRVATAVLGGVFVLVLGASVAFPQLWPTIAGWFAPPPNKLEAARQRSLPTTAEPWTPHQVAPPTEIGHTPTP